MTQTFISSEMHETSQEDEGHAKIHVSDRLNIFLYFWGAKHGVANSASLQHEKETERTHLLHGDSLSGKNEKWHFQTQH